MLINEKIQINIETEPVPQKMLDMLTYKNPEYSVKMQMGLPVFGVPKEIRTYHLEGKILTVWRGEALKIKPYIQNYEYNFNHTNHPIDIKYINNDFELDQYQERAIEAIKGNRQGIVHAVTSAGKSLIVLKSIVEIKKRTLIVVHLSTLAKQYIDDIEKYIRTPQGENISIGFIGAGKFSIGDITIGIAKSVSNKLDILKDEFEVIFLDEVHICPANSVATIINSINAKYRYGLSGTLRRKDQKEFLMYAAFGAVIATIKASELLEKGRVVPVRAQVLESQTRFDWDSAMMHYQDEKNAETKVRALRDKTIMLDPGRNDMILRKIDELKGKGKIVILSRNVEPCTILSERLHDEYGIESGILTGKNTKQALASYEAMKHGDLQVIFATIGCFSTGVSISDLEHLMLITPIFTNELLLLQIKGRLMRFFEGKKFGTFWFVYDKNIFEYYKLSKFLRIIKDEV